MTLLVVVVGEVVDAAAVVVTAELVEAVVVAAVVDSVVEGVWQVSLSFKVATEIMWNAYS